MTLPVIRSVTTTLATLRPGQSAQVTIEAVDPDSRTVAVTVSVRSPTLLGWCPPDSTTAQIRAMTGRYARPQVMRLYTGAGGGIAPWSSGILTQVPAGCPVHYSFKDWTSASPAAVREWLSARPAGRRDVVDLVTLDHEPEQQTAGDPSPAEFRQQWQELVGALAGHPRRAEVWLVPVFTEYAARRQASWWDDFGQVAAMPGVDAVGFDIYDTGYERYRTPAERNDFALAAARRVGKPLVVAEWGIKRKPTLKGGKPYDPDGALCAQAMRDNVAHLRAQPDVPFVEWFHRGDCNLDARGPERQAFVDLMG
ncbi:glycoside hydrolase family 26 protein [Micromonospora rubida]|uniref:hypothetical protein n=1 Tax=Micromonospora rubida TaxID=2697657 RepID=UPI0013781DE3|nr:hypothetical protein [Micromonospora rubida]NBE80315.1 hypothetical protein [Micromonospora rubida]